MAGSRAPWVEKPGERRRRFYRLTATGRRVLAQQRTTWDDFVEAYPWRCEPNMPDWKPDIRARLSQLSIAPSREAEIVEELTQHSTIAGASSWREGDARRCRAHRQD